ncbi:hypothetical protein Moror_1751 [Moniliophthora roreri MCA 2997]|uniref:F-box domain-containing protein n=1 Tax=Moniliophthora roreri (strain MCA 2997) TaxID=1381753 RepID=V2XLU1_MONRO|nr:hypothetical protein Moror_1751 [Moniliophthora roreri MCA 2997]
MSAHTVPLCDWCQHKFIPKFQLHRYPNVQPDDDDLRLNRFPNAADASEARKAIHEEESELKRYDEELARLRLAVERLEVQRDELYRRIKRRRSWLSPIRKLPIEVLETIFLYACSASCSHMLVLDSEAVFQHMPAYDLSRVSFHWRRVINAQPRLWSSIKADIFQLEEDVRPILQLYLRRSGNHPLEMDISCERYGVTAVDRHRWPLVTQLGEYGSQVFQIIFGHVSRCAELTLGLEVERLLGIVETTKNPISFPYLQTLSTQVAEGINASNRWFWEAIRWRSPMLKKVESGSLLAPDIVPYHQLISLIVNWTCTATAESLFEVLRCCTSIQSLALYEVYINNDARLNYPVELKALEHFTITFAQSFNNLSGFFDIVVLPSLVSIEINGGTLGQGPGVGGWRSTSFLAMIQRSGCTLRDFRLHVPSDDIPVVSFLDILQSCPGLKSLDVRLTGARHGSETFTYSLLRNLGMAPPGSILVPCLEKLCIDEVASRIDVQAVLELLDMVRIRRDIVVERRGLGDTKLTVLRDIRLRFDTVVGEPYTETLVRDSVHTLAEDGVKCSIDWAPPREDSVVSFLQAFQDI